MTSQVSNDAFKVIFPRYAQLLSEPKVPHNESIEQFLRDQLPRKVEMVRNMQTCFNAFLTHFTNIILKRPQHAHLIHSLILKANDKIQKYFQSISLAAHKLDNNTIKDRIPGADPQALRKEFRSRLESMGDLLKQKYFSSGNLTRECQQEVAMRLYVLFEIYHFLKGDPVTMASKFRIGQQDVLWSLSRNQQPGDIASLISLDPGFLQTVEDTVMKRCRPFISKRELLESKVRQALRQGQSRVGANLNLFLQSLLSKQRSRVSRELSASLGRQLRSIEEVEGQEEVRQMINEVESLKRQFSQIKNTTYFLDIMRGNFSEKYKMEIHRLENVFYLTNLEKYLQDVSTFLEKVLAVEERVIQNRKQYMRSFGGRVDIKIADVISYYQSKPAGSSLTDLILQQFQQLESALYGVIARKEVNVIDDSKKKEDRQRRDAERKRQMQLKAEEDRRKREEQKARLEERRRQEEQRIRMAKIQRQEKDRERREESERAQQARRAQLEKKRQQKAKKDEQQRRIREEEIRRKQEEKKSKELNEKFQREELARKRAEQQDKKKRQREEQNRRREEQRKRILQKEQEEKKRKEAQLKSRKEKEEQDRIRRQNQRKAEEERLKRQKQQRDQELKRKEEERISLEKQRKQKEQRQAEERKRHQEFKKLEKQQREKEQRQAQERKRQNDRKERQKRQQQERDKKERQRKEKQAEERRRQEDRKKEQQKNRLERQRKEKQLKEQKERQRKAEEERIAREKQEKRRRQQEEKAKKQQEKRQRQERQRRQRQERQRRQRQERQRRQRQQAEKAEKQKLEKERLEKERKQKERLQRQKEEKEKQQREKKLREEQQRKKQAEKQRLQKEKRDAEEKARLEKQREERQRKAELQRKKKEEEEKAKAKKPQPKKSSGINYGDFDDILDDDLQEMQRAGKLEPSGMGSGLNEDDDYDEDFQAGEDNGQEISTKQLISEADIKCLNDYMKGTSYARKNKVNAESVNKSSKYLEVFEELIQNRKLFIFQSAISKAIMDLGLQLTNPDTPEDDLHMSIDTIKQEMMKAYDEILPGEEMFPGTRYIYPFSFNNQFNIKLIEMIPAHTYFKIILNEPLPEDQAISEKVQSIIEGLLHIFELQGQPTLEEYVVNQESRLVLGTFDRQLPCLLLIFALHYERTNPKDILINQYTIERFFYTSNIIEPLYQAMKEGEQIQQFFNKVYEKYSTNDKIKVHSIAVNSSDPQYSQQLTHSALAIKEEFKKGKQTTVLVSFAIQIQEQGEITDKVVVYMSLDKATPKPVANYFLVSKDNEEQENATVIFELISEGDENFQVNVYTDFSRHNGLSSYSDWSLPLWAHAITKRKLSSLQAMRAMAFAMTPFYLAYKQVD